MTATDELAARPAAVPVNRVTSMPPTVPGHLPAAHAFLAAPAPERWPVGMGHVGQVSRRRCCIELSGRINAANLPSAPAGTSNRSTVRPVSSSPLSRLDIPKPPPLLISTGNHAAADLDDRLMQQSPLKTCG